MSHSVSLQDSVASKFSGATGRYPMGKKMSFKKPFLSRRSYRIELHAAILAGNRISNCVITESRFFIRSVPEFWKKNNIGDRQIVSHSLIRK